MAKNTSPKCKRCRRAGEKLFLKGDRCLGAKCSFSRRSYAPGIHGNSRRSRPTDYGTQLREKQKAKAIYGVLETQFRNYIEKAQKSDNTGFNLLKMLELRLDNVVYRSNYAKSRSQARQFVNHGHVYVNGKMLNIPSYECKEEDVVEVKNTDYQPEAKESIPSWLVKEKNGVKVSSIVDKSNIETNLNEQLIIEYYTR